MSIEKVQFSWNNWSTVEDLSRQFKRSKRRIQQIIAKSPDEIIRGILITDEQGGNVKAIPIYFDLRGKIIGCGE